MLQQLCEDITSIQSRGPFKVGVDALCFISTYFKSASYCMTIRFVVRTSIFAFDVVEAAEQVREDVTAIQCCGGCIMFLSFISLFGESVGVLITHSLTSWPFADFCGTNSLKPITI